MKMREMEFLIDIDEEDATENREFYLLQVRLVYVFIIRRLRALI